MEIRNDLIRFLAIRKIPLEEAIEILEQEAERVKRFKEKFKNHYEKSVLPEYETR